MKRGREHGAHLANEGVGGGYRAAPAHPMDAEGRKTGGRTAGTPNKSTRELKDFLGRVFTRAFTETRTVYDEVEGDEPGTTKKVAREVTLEDSLVTEIITLSLDPKLLATLLAHWAGSPAKAIDVNHKGRVTLEQIIAGTVPKDEPEGDS